MIQINRLNPTCTDIAVSGQKHQWYMLVADLHFDSNHCDRRLYYRHMDEARERNAKVLYFGDSLDLMEGRHDKRRSKDLRPEYAGAKYFQKVIDDFVGKHEKYADLMAFMSYGNHETSVIKNAEIDPLELITDKLGGKIALGSYQGWIRLKLNNFGERRYITKLFYHHGLWGGVVSKGTQAASRHAAMTCDADVIVSGHTHDEWILPMNQYHLRDNGEQIFKRQLHIKVPGYKEEFLQGVGFGVEKIAVPKTQNCIFLLQEEVNHTIRLHAEMGRV